MIRWIAILLFLGLTPLTSFAHEGEDEEHIAAIMEAYNVAFSYTPEQWEAHSPTTPYVDVKTGPLPWQKERVYLNGPMHAYLAALAKPYYLAYQEAAEHAGDMTEEDFTRQLMDRVGRNFIEMKASHFGHYMIESAEHISVGAARLGARYGKFALGMKVAGEVLETAVTKFVGGMHFLCNFIDIGVVLMTRNMQVATRSFTWAPMMERSRLMGAMSAWRAVAAVKRAQTKVQFVLEPVVLNEQMLKDLDREGPNRWWGKFGQDKNGKRAVWLKNLITKAEKVAGEQSAGELSMNSYLGRRYKRTLWLKARRRGHATYLHNPKAPMEAYMDEQVLWILSAQANLIDRVVVPKGSESALAKKALAYTKTAPEDEIRRGLADEFATEDGLLDKGQRDFKENLMKEVEVIFNPKVPKNVRYLQAVALEHMLGGFLYQIFSDILTEKTELLGTSPTGIAAQVRIHWNAGGIGNYIYQYADFLRGAALTTKPEVLERYKYEAMEVFMRAFSYLEKSTDLTRVGSVEQLELLEKVLTFEYKKATTFRPWSNKTQKRSWIPGRTVRPTCEEVNALPGHG